MTDIKRLDSREPGFREALEQLLTREAEADRRVETAVQDIIEEAAIEFAIARREISNEEIVERLVGALVEEGRKILDEGIAQRAGDIDIVYVYGYGFPAWRGGPMHYAESAGL